MTLTAKILNSDASLNSWKEIGSLDFQPGESQTLVLRLWDKSEDIRYIPPSGTTMTVTFNTGTSTLDKIATLNSDDRALATVALSATETENLIGGNFTFTLDEGGGTIRKGVVRNGMRKILTSC